MKRKGFTLIELLATIVILAVVSIITIPIVGNVIEDSKKKALEQSVRGLVETARYFNVSNEGVHEFLFDENKKGETKTGELLDYSGSIDAEGKLYIDNDGNISLCLMNESYYVYKNYNSGVYIGNRTENDCIVGYDALTNKYVAMLDDGTGSLSNVYSKEEINNIVDGLEDKIDTNTTSLNSITSIVSNNQSNIEVIQSELNKYALQIDLEETNSNVSIITNQVNTNKDDITSIKTQIVSLATSTNVETVNTLANKNKTDIASIQEQLGSMATTNNIESLNTLINENKTNISTNTTNITNLQNSLGVISSKIINFGWISNLDFQSEIEYMSMALYSGEAINAPSNYAGIAISYKADGMTVQKAMPFAENTIYIRNHTGEWTEWERMATESDLDNKLSNMEGKIITTSTNVADIMIEIWENVPTSIQFTKTVGTVNQGTYFATGFINDARDRGGILVSDYYGNLYYLSYDMNSSSITYKQLA